MKNTFLTTVAIVALSVLIGACNSSGVNCNNNFALGLALSDELQALSEAQTAYSQDQSPENCENYKEAYREYIQELKRYEGCAYQNGQGQQYEEDLEEAEEELDDLC